MPIKRDAEGRLDAASQAYIQQQLQFILAEVVRTPFGPKKAARLIPLQGGIPRGAQEWGYDRVTHLGIARWLASDATDIPFSEVQTARVVFPVKKTGAGYRVSDDDVDASMMAGTNVPAEKAIAVREAIDRFINDVWISGDATVGLEGFINSANVTAGSVVTGNWAAATPTQILADMSTVMESILVTTREVYEANTIVLPIAQYGLIHRTRVDPADPMTIATAFKMNNPGVMFERLSELDGAGAGATDRMVVYKKDPQVVRAVYAYLFEAKPPQERGYGYDVPCSGKIGGTTWLVPIAAAYGDGI